MRIPRTQPGRVGGKTPEPAEHHRKEADRWSDPEQRIMRAIARSSIHWRRFVL